MDLRDFKNYKDKNWEISEKYLKDQNSQYSEIPFNELPIKVSNALKRNGIFKLTQLVDLEEKDYLFQFKNFGTKAFLELRIAFESIGLKIPITIEQLKKAFPDLENNYELDDKEKFLKFKISFEELGFPSVISDSLKWYGFFDLSDLIGLEEKDFLNFKDIDVQELDKLKILLKTFDLTIPISLDQSTKYLSDLKRNKITDEQNNESYVPGFYLTFEEFKEFLSIEEIPTISGFNSFENKIKELENSPKKNNILILLITSFQILDAIDFEYNFLSAKELTISKKTLKYFLLLKFLAINSFEKNQEWLIKFNKAIQRDEYQKKLLAFLLQIHGITLSEIGKKFDLSRERVRQLCARIVKDFGLEFRDIKDFTKDVKRGITFIEEKNEIIKLIKRFGRLPINSDICDANLNKNQIFQNVQKIFLSERIDLYNKFDLSIPAIEFDYHFEYLRENDYPGPRYWSNFDLLKEYIFRHAKDIGEPELMPKQTSFIRRGASGAITRFGGQSAVAKKLGLKYQGQLVNESGGRVFWTEERINRLLHEVNILFDQDPEVMPGYSQVVDFFDLTDIEIFKGKKPQSAMARMTSMGNLTWAETAEKYGKKILIGKSQRANTNYIKAFVRDLGEHLAVLTPSELYVLFQAQGIGSKGRSNYSRTFDFLIEAVQNGEIKKKDLQDWSNNLEVPSINELLNLGSELNSKVCSKEKRDLILLNRRKRIINEAKNSPKIIDLNKVVREDLPKLDPIKSLKALDKAAGLINIQGSDSSLINFLKAKATAKLWDNCFSDEESLIKKLESNYFDKDAYSSQIKNTFLDEYYGAKALEIPNVYKFKDLKGREREPKLMQRLVAFRLKRDKRLLNLSGTGTGKTLSAILSAQICKCKRVFISCPNGVVDSWLRTLQSAYPSACVHVKPDNWEVNVQNNDVNVVIVNHERFQNRFSEDMLRFCMEYETDLLVIDEIHQSKSRDPKRESQRRALIGEFIRIGFNLKPDIRILGLSATPVINNLYEGTSLLELITQQKIIGTNTNDINACMVLYQNFILNGIRMNPGNLSRTKIIRKDIDASHLLPNILEITNSPKTGNYHEIERLLVRPKLSSLRKFVKKDQKTIIFITNIKGTLIPLKNWFTKEGINFCVYTGEDKDATEVGFHDSLDEFIRGQTNVLIASIQCAGTGVDGLQSICNNAVFFQLPWTSTEFEQSIGRLDRDGTEFDSINIYLPITNLNLPNGDNWSWCQSKLDRIESKKDIAKAAVDGDMPDSGSIISPQEATKLWLKWLKRLENSEQT